MFRSGAFVAEQLGDVSPGQVQPNGVDLTLAGVLEQREPGRIGVDGKTVGERRELAPEPEAGGDEAGDDEAGDGGQSRGAGERGDERATYALAPGGYVARYGETVRVPEGHVGFVLPRSSLMRNSCMLNTAVWDAGYEGRGEGLLQVHHDVELERGARIAQFVLAEAEHEDVYDGSYQGERL